MLYSADIFSPKKLGKSNIFRIILYSSDKILVYVLYTTEFARLIKIWYKLTFIFCKSTPKCVGASIAARAQTTFFGLPIT